MLAAFFFGNTATGQQFGGNPASLRWLTMNSGDCRIVYPLGLDSQARRISRIISALHESEQQSNGTRMRHWPVVLQSETMIPNAYVRMAPVMSELFMTPPQNSFRLGSLRWDDNLVIHEQRHMQQFSRFRNGFTKVFSFFLGEEGQLLANGMCIPDYFFEGDAVWQETALSRQGRGRLPYFFNEFRALWLDKRDYNWMKWRSGSLRDLVPDHYSLGYLLTAYGYRTGGDGFWQKVTDDAHRFRGVFYPFNRAISRHSGRTYKQFRNEAFDYFREQLLPGQKIHSAARFLTDTGNRVVTDELFPMQIGKDSIIVLRSSYREPGTFYLITGKNKRKIRMADVYLDPYFSSNGRTIIYTGYRSDPRWYNRDRQTLLLLDIASGKQRTVETDGRYFSPDINKAGNRLLAVHVSASGRSALHLLDAKTGNPERVFPNPGNDFITQSKFMDDGRIVSAVRAQNGEMALLAYGISGKTDTLVPFSRRVIGYPQVKGRLVYFSAQDGDRDQLFSVDVISGEIHLLTREANSLYYPFPADDSSLLASLSTANGYRMVRINAPSVPGMKYNWGSPAPNWSNWQPVPAGEVFLDTIRDAQLTSRPFRKAFRLFDVHSRRPLLEDPEWGYALYTDNFFSTLSGSLSYTYNRVERSHNMGAALNFGGWFPVISLGADAGFNRSIDTAVGKPVIFNSAKWSAGVSIPLQWIKGRGTHQFISSLSFNSEQLYYTGIGKNIFSNRSFQYIRAGLAFSRAGRQARQQIFPRWAQSLSLIYRHASSDDRFRKFTGNGSFYFPGLSGNHSLVIQASFQRRDSLPDIFNNTFAYSRGYDALSTRQMMKWGINYHLPLLYPDLGFANILFCQRIRANLFYDHTVARARINGLLADIRNRSAGAELYFDNKLWNALPVSVGFRYAYLLDRNLRNPSLKSRWEIVLPVGIIPD